MTVPIKDERSPLRRVAGSTAGRSAIVVAVFVAALWGIEVVDAVAGNSLDQWGIHPRVGSGRASTSAHIGTPDDRPGTRRTGASPGRGAPNR